jgi:hypothetical protein
MGRADILAEDENGAFSRRVLQSVLLHVQQHLLDPHLVCLDVVEVLFSILDLDVWQPGNHFAIFERETEEVCRHIHIVRLCLVKFAGNDVLNRSSNIELGFALHKIVVLDHAEAHEVLKVQKKFATFVHEKLSALFSKFDKLLHLVEVFIGDLILQQIVGLCELFNHNLENFALVHDAAEWTVDLVRNRAIDSLVHFIRSFFVSVGLEIHGEISKLQDERRIRVLLRLLIIQGDFANPEVVKPWHGENIVIVNFLNCVSQFLSESDGVVRVEAELQAVEFFA